MRTVMLLNPKGGSGKTTIATNLAAYYAGRGFLTALFDHDAQGSSTRWLEVRPATHAAIHGVAAYQKPVGMTRSWQLGVPVQAQKVIVDTPAGLTHPYLTNLVRTADSIVIPVLPSPIDIDAVVAFVKELRRVEPVCKRTVRIAAVVNRMCPRSRAIRHLVEALRGVDVSTVALLRESPRYLRASAEGEGIHEQCGDRRGPRIDDWWPLLAWLDGFPGQEPGRDQARSTPVAERVAVPV